jgi:hypothetical protein
MNDSTESGAVRGLQRDHQSFVLLTKQGDQRLPGYEVPHSPSGGLREIVCRSSSARDKNRQNAASSPQQSLHSLKPLLLSAQNLAREMTSHANAQELIDLANSGFALLDALDELWHHRASKEPDWGDLVNLLRTAMTKIEFEKLSTEQCKLIARFVDECLCSGTVDTSEHQLGLRLLRKANLDPWRVLAQRGA